LKRQGVHSSFDTGELLAQAVRNGLQVRKVGGARVAQVAWLICGFRQGALVVFLQAPKGVCIPIGGPLDAKEWELSKDRALYQAQFRCGAGTYNQQICQYPGFQNERTSGR